MPRQLGSRSVWRVRLFGGLSCDRGDGTLDLPPASTHPLLAALLTGPRRVQRVPLARELYPELDESAARQRVSHQLWLLRQRWPEVPLEVGREVITIPADAWVVDVAEFRHLARAEDAETALRALSLTARGPLLPEVDNPFVGTLREELRVEAAQLRLRLSRRMLDIGELELSVELAQASVAEDPLDERRVLQLVRALIAVGRRADAKAEFTRYALAAEQLGVPLGPEISNALEAGPEVVPVGGTATSVRAHDVVATVLRALRAGRIDAARPLVRGLGPEHPDRPELEGLLAAAEGHRELALDRFATSTTGVGAVRQAETLLAAHDLAEAETLARTALLEVERGDAAAIRAAALVVLSRCALLRGDAGQAGAFADRAVQEARRVRGRYELARARHASGRALLAVGQFRPAMDDLRRAWSIGDEEGYRFVAIEAGLDLGAAAARTGALRRAAVVFAAVASIARDAGAVRSMVVAETRRVDVLSRLGAHGEAMKSARSLSVDDEVRRDAWRRHRAIGSLLRAATWLGTRPARGTVGKLLASEQVAELEPIRLVHVRTVAALRSGDPSGALEHLETVSVDRDATVWGTYQALRAIALADTGDQAGAQRAAHDAVLHAGSGQTPLDLASFAWFALSRSSLDVDEAARARHHGAQRIVQALQLNIDAEAEVDADGFLTRDEVQRELRPTVKELLRGLPAAASDAPPLEPAEPEAESVG